MSTPNLTEPVKLKLDRPKFDQLAGALGRLEDIKNLSALSTTREVEAEALGLVEFLSKELIDHAPEMLGCWFVVKAEYEPLCNALVPMVNRCNSIISQRIAQQEARVKAAAAAPAAAPTPGNIITLD